MTPPIADALETVVHRTAEHLPDGVKRRLSGPYNRVQERRANRAFRQRDRPDLTPAADAPRHVVVVVVDALRADAVDPDVTPFLHDRTVGSAITPAPWTFPAVSSIVTGQYPHEHGAMRQSDAADRSATDLVLPPALADDAATLPEAFAAAGYDTYGGFAFHMPFFALAGRFGEHALHDQADADAVLDGYESWLATREPERSFAYLHLGDLHEPVDPPDAYWRVHDVADIDGIRRWRYETDTDPGPAATRYREHRRRLYRAALDYVDDRLVALRGRLGERVGDPALVVTGDHGEGFWEHAALDAERFVDSRPAYCVDHGGTPYEGIARVPLATEGLPVETLSPDRPASLIDVAPTLLDALGCPDALDATGTSLASGVPADRVPLVEACRYGHEKKAAYADGWKLVVSERDDEAVAFRLPDETVGEPPADVARRLRAALPAWPDGSQADVAVSGLARERLEDLGYV